MALNVASEVSFDEPWKGRSTPTTSVLLVVVPPPPDLLHAAAPTRVTTATASAVMRLVMRVLSVIDRVVDLPRHALIPRPVLPTHSVGLRAPSPTLSVDGPGRARRPTARAGECRTIKRGEASLRQDSVAAL